MDRDDGLLTIVHKREHDLMMNGFLLEHSSNPEESFFSAYRFGETSNKDVFSQIVEFRNNHGSAKVQYSLRACKRGEQKKHYNLPNLGVHIFVIGMCFLDEEHKHSYIGKIEQQIVVDEDYIPYIFANEGVNGLHRIRGEYNLIIIDEASMSVEIITSHFGLLPLYYTRSGKRTIVSDSLYLLGIVSGNNELNIAVLAHLCLYNYSVTDEAMLKNCKILAPGLVFTIDNEGVRESFYWSAQELLGQKVVSDDDSVELLDFALNRAVTSFSKQVGGCAISLTGGWDGRLALAYLLKTLDPSEAENHLLYSFGTEGSPDIRIPSIIATKLGLKYNPIVLDEDYLLTEYLQSAKETSRFSDGYRSIKRAHYLYAMSVLSKNYSCVLSGICGSNVMKKAPNAPGGLVFNNRVFELVSSGDYIKTLTSHFDILKGIRNKTFNNLGIDSFLESINGAMIERTFSCSTYAQRYSTFVFSFLERKYFGPEISSYKHIIGNYSPFIDIGFIKALAKTPYFNGARSSKTIFSNMENSVLYAKLMRKNNRELCGFVSDKFVKLDDLLSPINYPLIGLKQLYRKKLYGKFKKLNLYNTSSYASLFRTSCRELHGSLIDSNGLSEEAEGLMLSVSFWYNNLLDYTRSRNGL